MVVNYDDVRDNLDTGDIVLFSGKGLISKAKNFSTQGDGLELLLGATLSEEIVIKAA